MSKFFVLLAAVGLLAPAAASAQQKSGALSNLTDKDRAEMQGLVTHYAVALGTCAAEEYADLFAAPDGSFASGPRAPFPRLTNLLRWSARATPRSLWRCMSATRLGPGIWVSCIR